MNETEQLKPGIIETTVFSEQLEHFFNASLKLDIPVAIWRLPNTQRIQAVCQLDNVQEKIEELENSPAGFIFHPFQEEDGKNRHFVRADLRFCSDEHHVQLNPTLSKSSSKVDTFMSTMDQMADLENVFNYSDYLEPAPVVKTDREDYINLVLSSKEQIEKGQYQKIVPSRRANFRIPRSFRPVQEMILLCNAYESAFISLVYLPGVGIWLGASPELLISIKNKKYFETISLAGTQEIAPNFDLAKAAWTQKEIEEQALVSRYIVNCFKQIRLREFEEFGPKTVKAGNLMHLKTSFKVDMDEVNFPQLGTVMLNLLHPTSAVCGMPMLPAAQFLKENEGYDREYFSGYLGPVNIDDDIHIYVNLRCASIYKNGGIVYAGAGVTEDSDAESEWNETQIKFQTLLNVIAK